MKSQSGAVSRDSMALSRSVEYRVFVLASLTPTLPNGGRQIPVTRADGAMRFFIG
jgi:hypothetical protein